MTGHVDPRTGRPRIGFHVDAREEVLEAARTLEELTGRPCEVVTCDECGRLHVVTERAA